MIVHTLKMCRGDAGPEQSLVLFPFEMRRGCLVCVICNFQQFLFLYIQTLHNDCSYIEDVHILFCLHFMIFFFIFGGLELRHFFL